MAIKQAELTQALQALVYKLKNGEQRDEIIADAEALLAKAKS